MNESARILIVDDEPNLRLVFRTALDTRGYEVEEASDGEQALIRLQQEPPIDLVLLDLRIPWMDGIATLRSIRDRGLSTPVVVITAHGTKPDTVEAMKLGAIDFLSKPVTPQVLRGLVTEDVSHHASEPRTTTSTLANREEQRFDEVLARAKRALNRLRPIEAEEYLRRAISLGPGSPTAHTLLGILLMSRGGVHSARAEFHAALISDPGHEPAQHQLRHLQARFWS